MPIVLFLLARFDFMADAQFAWHVDYASLPFPY
jgi:hypothetical protein